MSFVENLRKQIMDPNTDAERIANLTSLLTCGYIVGGRNEKLIERWFAQIIAQVDEFLSPLSEEQKRDLPNGVMRRLTEARNEAQKFADSINAQEYVLAPTCCSGNCDACGICAEPD